MYRWSTQASSPTRPQVRDLLPVRFLQARLHEAIFYFCQHELWRAKRRVTLCCIRIERDSCSKTEGVRDKSVIRIGMILESVQNDAMQWIVEQKNYQFNVMPWLL